MNEPERIAELFAVQLSQTYFTVIDYLPNLIGALGLLLLGIVLALILRFLFVRATRFGVRRLQRVRQAYDMEGRLESVPRFVGRIVFWFVLLLAIASSVAVLDIPALSNVIDEFTAYLPKVLAAALIVLFTLLLGDLVRNWVDQAAARMRVAVPQLAGRLVQVLIWIVATVLAVNQLGIESEALLILLAVFMGSIFGASALAFGLGARTTVANIIATHYVQKSYAVGDRVRIAELEGVIAQITRTHVVLSTNQGRAHVPSYRFSENVAHLLPEGQ